MSEKLYPTGLKIIADRYYQKGGKLEVGAPAMAVIDKAKALHEQATVIAMDGDDVTVEFADKTTMTLKKDQVDVLKESRPSHMWDRIAKGASAHFPKDKAAKKQESFYFIQNGFKYLPGGRINASMGAVNEKGEMVQTTSYNCFVIPNVMDYARSLGQALEIQSRSGGVGLNLSYVLPQGMLSPQQTVNPLNMMMVMDVWHPDFEAFLKESYPNSTKVARISPEFRQAVEVDADWTFEFPDTKTANYNALWDGDLKAWKKKGLPVIQGETVSATELYQAMLQAGVAITDGIVFGKIVQPSDSRESITNAVGEIWNVMLEGKKAAVVLSSLRPRYYKVSGVNGRSSGAYSWGTLYDKANWAYAEGFGPVAIAEIFSICCQLVIQGGSRRGALMIVLADWHIDILKFINAKRNQTLITGANISVLVSDKFMEAKAAGLEYNLGYVRPEALHEYEADYTVDEDDFVFVQSVSARDIWQNMMESAWASAEPGVVFITRYNEMSNSFYFNSIICTNPCGKMLASR